MSVETLDAPRATKQLRQKLHRPVARRGGRLRGAGDRDHYGHSLKAVETILDAHYLYRRTKLAHSAVAKLGRAAATGTDGEQTAKQITNTRSGLLSLEKRRLLSDFNGGRTRTRTLDSLIKRQCLSL